ncbi:MAG TPA: response regulator [Candidatus Dormibacteraeota bacterium]|nr:response regulator [Candidatus Dormibacteraeota bacterium]
MKEGVDRERPLVLVADDDEDILALVSLQLERAEMDVIRASNGDEALALALEHVPDLAVLDVMMPGLNGYQVVEKLRHEDRTHPIPLILLTARAGGADAKYGYQVGADDYIKKPFSPHELRERVQSLLTDGRPDGAN